MASLRVGKQGIPIWFNSFNLINIVDSLDHTFIFRLKSNLNIKVYDKKEGHYVRKQTGDLLAYIYQSVSYKDVLLFEDHNYKTNIVKSKKNGIDDAWILATNGDCKRAVKDYGYRFGGIECIFKNQKSNCFYLEDIVNASIKYFENLYATMCIALLLCVCLGVEYSKNRKCYKNINSLKTLQNITYWANILKSFYRF